ncbi:MAG: hypothetical protein HOP08_15975 [Cyclobacteriaceae bacterium]|nr:hypothetical protein [Cyclobacteriaceae bacterium]
MVTKISHYPIPTVKNPGPSIDNPSPLFLTFNSVKFSLSLALLLFLSHLAFSQEGKDTLRIPTIKLPDPTTKIDSASKRLNNKLDSINIKVPGDSASRAAIHKADSIRSHFQSSVDSIQLSYRKPINHLDSAGRTLQHRIDSLRTLKLPTTKLTAKLDSINMTRNQKLSELNGKVDRAKQKATKGLGSIELPPQMQDPVNKLSQSINGYSIPMVNGSIPNVSSSAQLPGLQIPGVNINNPSLGNANIPGAKNPSGLPGINNPAADLSKISNQAKGYGEDLNKIKDGNVGEVKNLDKTAENEVMKSQAAGEIKDKTAEVDKYKSQLKGRPDSAALNMVKQEAMKEATNHFAGQEAVLQQAMDKMAKLKTKYDDVKSMAELPKKLPNPLHDKPFIERIVPHINFQIISTGSFVGDVSIGALYKISPRFSAGAGWVQRIAFDRQQRDQRMYGPRAIVQYNLPKGFSLRFVPEYDYANVSRLAAPNVHFLRRQWIWSAFVGIKKDFRVYKSVRGTTEALYNLYNPDNQSPYKDQIAVRFGFEFPLK